MHAAHQSSTHSLRRTKSIHFLGFQMNIQDSSISVRFTGTSKSWVFQSAKNRNYFDPGAEASQTKQGLPNKLWQPRIVQSAPIWPMGVPRNLRDALWTTISASESWLRRFSWTSSAWTISSLPWNLLQTGIAPWGADTLYAHHQPLSTPIEPAP